MACHPLDRLPSLRVLPRRVPAPIYNTLRVAQLRASAPLELALQDLAPGLWGLLDGRGWVVMDGFQHDLPLLAWTGFAPAPGRSLHEPVVCELRVFHRCAGMIMGEALEALHRAGARRLGREAGARCDGRSAPMPEEEDIRWR